MSSISATVAKMLQQPMAPSPFSCLRGKHSVDLTDAFPNSHKNYTYELKREIGEHMTANGITFATITTKSQSGPTKKFIVHLRAIKKEHSKHLKDVTPEHPELLQHLFNGCYVLSPQSLIA